MDVGDWILYSRFGTLIYNPRYRTLSHTLISHGRLNPATAHILHNSRSQHPDFTYTNLWIQPSWIRNTGVSQPLNRHLHQTRTKYAITYFSLPTKHTTPARTLNAKHSITSRPMTLYISLSTYAHSTGSWHFIHKKFHLYELLPFSVHLDYLPEQQLKPCFSSEIYRYIVVSMRSSTSQLLATLTWPLDVFTRWLCRAYIRTLFSCH